MREHIPCMYSMFTIRALDGIQNNNIYWDEDCMWILKKFCKEDNKLEKKKTIPLTYERQASYKKVNICFVCKKIFAHKYTNMHGRC